MKKKPVCFISYSHEDIDRETVGYFKFLLKKYARDSFDVLIDDDLPIAADLDEFMNLLKSKVDAVVILMTPSYKNKILKRNGGAYTEAKIIFGRHQEVQGQLRRGKKSGEIEGYLELLPVLYAGRPEDAVPDEIKNLKYLDFRSFRAVRNKRGGYQVNDFVSRTYVPQILQIVKALNVIAVLKSQSFDDLVQSYYPRLFLELKADWTNPRDRGLEYHERLFVKTEAYRHIANQTAYFMIGRKGSGKTTIRDVLAIRESDRYFGHICINADEFNLEYLYSFFGNDRHRSDIDRIFNRVECFKYAWDAFLAVCCMQALVDSRQSDIIGKRQQAQLRPIIAKLKEIDPDSLHATADWNARYVFCFNGIFLYLDACIERARSDERFFYADLSAHLNRAKFMTYLLGREAWEAYEYLMKVMQRNVLVSLDGFDSTFEEFRRRSMQTGQGYVERAQFEIDWLRALLQLVVDGTRMHDELNPLYKHAEYCITVPYDRFTEVATSERDSFKYQQRYRELKWSGIELTILLRKRLEELTQVSTDKNKRPEERLERVLQEKFSHIPLELEFMFNGRQYQMALFHYVLRHTFWRPREILKYYAHIIAGSESLRQKGHPVDTQHLRGFVNNMTSGVIQSEFIGELETALFNIEEILHQFERSAQVLPFEAVEELLAPIQFRFASQSLDTARVEAKIRFLYSIGFLGVYADARMQQRFNLVTSHVFHFSEGNDPVTLIGQKGFQGYRFIIHPVFKQRLDLDTSGNELILNYTWPYLHELEAASR